MNTFEIALKTKQLPDKIEDLVPMMFAGQAAVRFMAAKLKAVSDKNVPDPLGLLENQRQKTVEDGQAMGEMLLVVMGKIGELSEKTPQSYGKPIIAEGGGLKGRLHADILKHEKLGLSNEKFKQAKFIKNHPELVKETIAECRKNDDIPNITTVLNKHKHACALAKEKERYEKAVKEGRTEKSKIELNLEQREYLLKLEKVVASLPKEPPREWNKRFYDDASDYVAVIIERLKPFLSIYEEQIKKYISMYPIENKNLIQE